MTQPDGLANETPPIVAARKRGHIDLTLHGRRVETVFDLLGSKEDDITYAVGWGLANSHSLAYALLAEVFPSEVGELTALRLQEAAKGTGRTDIEVETDDVHLIVEAKRGWEMPGLEQLSKYATRLNESDSREGRILVVAEATMHFGGVRSLPASVGGVPVRYVPWSLVADLVRDTADTVVRRAEKHILRELHQYLRSLMTSQNVTSNMVYVVSLNHDEHDWSDLTFVQTVMDRDRYYHPVGGTRAGWPKTPPNYLGFRFDGELQRVSHVESYNVTTRPHDHIPEVKDWVDWSEEPHFIYELGPALPLPPHPVKSTGMRSRRALVALDLLLTCPTIMQAEQETRKRLSRTPGLGGV